MSDNLVIGGATFTGVTGIKATDTNDNVVTFESGGITVDEIAKKTLAGEVSSEASGTITDAFRGYTHITSLSFPNITNISSNAFMGCTGLQRIYFPSVTGTGNAIFQNCSNLLVAALPKLTGNWTGNTIFSNCSKLTAVDLGPISRFGNGNVVERCTVLTTLILRRTADITTLPSVAYFKNSPFASGNAGGTLYVPSALISSYQSATNWSTILGYTDSEGNPQNQILPIEGSIYETQYADGTPIPTT